MHLPIGGLHGKVKMIRDRQVLERNQCNGLLPPLNKGGIVKREQLVAVFLEKSPTFYAPTINRGDINKKIACGKLNNHAANIIPK
jgi:hypothetical protein